MSGYVTRIRTTSGDLQIDYNALANLPDKPKLQDFGINAKADEINKLIGVTQPVQSQIDAKIAKSGDTMTGNLNMSGNAIKSLKNPTEDGDAANMQYVNSVGLSYRGLTSDYNMNDPSIPQGIYEINGTAIQGVSEGLVFHNQVRPGLIATQTVVSSNADKIWVRTYWHGVWNKFRYIGFDYGTESELPENAQDGQLFFVKA